MEKEVIIKRLVIIIIIFCVIVATLYYIFNNFNFINKKSTSKIELISDGCDEITVNDNFPMTDEVGRTFTSNKESRVQAFCKFEVKSNESTKYSLYLSDLDYDNLKSYLNEANMHSYILVPLTSKHIHFGSLIVFSSRESATENELNFLNLFARQIELAITIADLFQAVKEQAVTDGMTGLYNRRYFEEFIKKEAIRSDRQNQKFTVIGLDLDNLKNINDTYGHNYGDIAIKAIAEVLKSNARAIDIAARMGGEEFNLVLPGVDSKGGLVAAERIKKAIQAVKLEKIGKITASLGVATYFEHSDDTDELLELADQAMYEDKRAYYEKHGDRRR